MMWHLNLFFSVFLLTSCEAHNNIVDVKYLQKKVASCVGNKQAACLQQKTKLERLEKLAITLEAAPQAFGLSILRLQQRLVSAQQRLEQAKAQNAAKQQLQELEDKSTQLQQNYEERLAVLRWLEAPDQ